MTKILSWNIQNGTNTEGVISLKETASVIRSMGDPELICLQEVSRNLQRPGDSVAADQPAELSELFPGYELVFGVALEAATHAQQPRWQYGNVILSRLPVLSIFHHSLPQPVAEGIRHMARQATELTVASETGPLRITTTHLEYHSRPQREAQIARLAELHSQCVLNSYHTAKTDAHGPYQEVVRPANSILCGDFNIEPWSNEYQILTNLLNTGKSPMVDAWTIIGENKPHPDTCGVYDRIQWPQGPHCRDYFFVTDSIAQSIKTFNVNCDSNASDHQAIFMEFAD